MYWKVIKVSQRSEGSVTKVGKDRCGNNMDLTSWEWLLMCSSSSDFQSVSVCCFKFPGVTIILAQLDWALYSWITQVWTGNIPRCSSLPNTLSMLGTVLSTFQVLLILPPQPYVLGTVVSPVPQMRKTKPREAQKFSEVIKLLPDIQSLACHAHIFNFLTRQHRW